MSPAEIETVKAVVARLSDADIKEIDEDEAIVGEVRDLVVAEWDRRAAAQNFDQSRFISPRVYAS
jgi:hypothetical protein